MKLMVFKDARLENLNTQLVAFRFFFRVPVQVMNKTILFNSHTLWVDARLSEEVEALYLRPIFAVLKFECIRL